MRIPGYCFVQIIPAVTDNQNSLHESGTVVQKWHVVFVTSSNNLFPMLIQDCLTFNFVEPAVYCQQEQFYHLQLHVLQLHHRRPPFLHVAPEHRLDHRRPRCQDTAVRFGCAAIPSIQRHVHMNSFLKHFLCYARERDVAFFHVIYHTTNNKEPIVE